MSLFVFKRCASKADASSFSKVLILEGLSYSENNDGCDGSIPSLSISKLASPPRRRHHLLIVSAHAVFNVVVDDDEVQC